MRELKSSDMALVAGGANKPASQLFPARGQEPNKRNLPWRPVRASRVRPIRTSALTKLLTTTLTGGFGRLFSL
jgi:hypothetical protein